MPDGSRSDRREVIRADTLRPEELADTIREDY
jgi:fructose transport system substrate-binding protein